MISIPTALTLLALHFIIAMLPQAFTPDACDPGDLACGSPVIQQTEEQLSGMEEKSLGGFNPVDLWKGIKDIATVLKNLFTFGYPWLSSEGQPEAMAFILLGVRTTLAVVQGVIFLRAMFTALGRN